MLGALPPQRSAHAVGGDLLTIVLVGCGGRQVRNVKRNGHIFDHHDAEYAYADGTRMISQCRQIPGCWRTVSEHVLAWIFACATELTNSVSAAR